jgi:hypothetical protein
MGASQSVQNEQDTVQRELESIRRQLETVSLPEQATELVDILPYYSHVVAKIDPKATPQQIAVTYLMISSHAQATRLSKTYATLTAELSQCQKLLTTLYEGIIASKSSFMQFCGVEETGHPANVETTKDWKVKELADTVTFMANELIDVQKYLFHLLNITLQASQTCISSLSQQRNTCESISAELGGALQVLRENSLALRNMLETVMSNYRKAVDSNDELLETQRHLIKVGEEFSAFLKCAEKQNQALREQNAKLTEECRQKDLRVGGLDTEINGLYNALKQAESIKLRNKAHELSEQAKDQEEVKQLRAEIARLKGQSNKVEALRAENSRLKAKLKDSNIKDLEKQLHHANAESDRLRALFKDMDDGVRPQDENAQHIDAISSDEEELSNTVEGLSFAEGAAKIFKRHRVVLGELRDRISQMNDIRGGSGWSIVQRTDSMVKRKTARMLNEINDCLALRNAGEREKERMEQLETQGFPVLQKLISGASQRSKKNKKKNKGESST